MLDAVRAKTGWKDSYVSVKFGYRSAAECLRKNTIQLRTAEAFKEWMQKKLDE